MSDLVCSNCGEGFTGDASPFIGKPHEGCLNKGVWITQDPEPQTEAEKLVEAYCDDKITAAMLKDELNKLIEGKSPTPPGDEVGAIVLQDANEKLQERIKLLEGYLKESDEKARYHRIEYSELVRVLAKGSKSQFTKDEEVWLRIAEAYTGATNATGTGTMKAWSADALEYFAKKFQ